MKRSQLKQIIKEVLLEEKGYSKFAPGGTTSGLSQETLEQILLKIAQQGAESEDIEEKYEGDPERGNKILDTADQENVDKIIRGEDPYVSRMQDLAGIKNEIKIEKPNRLLRYKKESIDIFEKIKKEDKIDGEDGLDNFYDSIIQKISNSDSEEEINDIVFKDWFFGDDVQGMEDFKNDIEEKINGSL